MTLAELVVKLSMQGQGQVKQGLDQTRTGLQQVATQGVAATASLAGLQRTLLAVGAAFGGIRFASGALEAAAQYDSLQRGLATTVSTTAELNAQMSELRRIALLPGIDLQQTVKGFIQLRSANLGVQESTDAMKSLANAVASVGGSSSSIEGVVRALSQMASKAKISQEEINQLTEHLPQAGLIVERAFGTRNTEAIQKMGITGRDAARRIIQEFAKLPPATAGIRTQLDNLQDTFFNLQVAVGNFGAALLRAIGPQITKGLENITKFFNTMPQNAQKISAAAGIIAGSLAMIGGARVVSSIRSVITELVRLYNIVKAVGIGTAVSEALATGGASAIPALAGAAAVGAAGIGIGLYTQKLINDALGNMQIDIPTTGAAGGTGPDLPGMPVLPGGGSSADSPYVSKSGNVVNGLYAALGTLLQGGLDLRRQQTQWLGEIADNTRRTFQALDLRAETLGGGALARLGVTGAERKSEFASEAVSRFAGATVTVGGSQLERQVRKVIADELRRTGGRPVRRN